MIPDGHQMSQLTIWGLWMALQWSLNDCQSVRRLQKMFRSWLPIVHPPGFWISLSRLVIKFLLLTKTFMCFWVTVFTHLGCLGSQTVAQLVILGQKWVIFGALKAFLLWDQLLKASQHFCIIFKDLCVLSNYCVHTCGLFQVTSGVGTKGLSRATNWVVWGIESFLWWPLL